VEAGGVLRFSILDGLSDADRETEKATTIGTAAAFSTEMTVLDETHPKSKIGNLPGSHDGARGSVGHALLRRLFHRADIRLVRALTRAEAQAQQQASEYPKVLHGRFSIG